MIRWRIPFVPLRESGVVYTVNIYDDSYTGSPITLKGGAEPFTTDERDDEDEFMPVRTQSGYVRIVDDGKDADGNALGADWWKQLVPKTNTDRMIILTKTVGSTTTNVWYGSMQAINFGGTLYGNPQEREFPIQCSLTTLSEKDMNASHTYMENFAYLLYQICRNTTWSIQSVVIQGGWHAIEWLQKIVDWQNFVTEDTDDVNASTVVAKYTYMQLLEEVCRFWGWTARVYGNALYLTCADDANETAFVTMSALYGGDLYTLANGGTVSSPQISYFVPLTLSGDIFASTNNDDFMQDDAAKAIVRADTNRGDDDVLNPFNDSVISIMNNAGRGQSYYSGSKSVQYTIDITSINQPFIWGSCASGYGAFNLATQFIDGDEQDTIPVIRILKTGNHEAGAYVALETVYEHQFTDGFFRMYGETWLRTEKYVESFREHTPIGRGWMYVRIGIGKTRGDAVWWNGRSWQSSITYCRMSLGNKPNTIDHDKNEFMFMYLQYPQASTDDWGTNLLPAPGVAGQLWLDFLGTTDTRIPETDGERCFELSDFRMEFTRNPGVTKIMPAAHFVGIDEKDRPTVFGYKAGQDRDVWETETIFATENACKFSYGEIVNPDGTFTESVTYGSGSARPEQHLANRVAAYWANSKRMIDAELRADVGDIGNINPRYKLTMDGTTMHPIAISRNWRDSVMKVRMLEV